MKLDRVRAALARWWPALASVALVIAAMGPALRLCVRDEKTGVRQCIWTFHRLGFTDDWRYFAGVWEAARITLTDFHQMPSWNPYHCGGIILFQDPQGPFPSPLFLLMFAWVPPGIAMKLWIMLHMLAGAFGARALVREQGGDATEQLLAATMVTACGFCAWHFGGGHLSFAPFLLFPWLLWSQRRSVRDTRYAILTASLLALCVYEGATYPVPLMLVGLAADGLARLFLRDERAGMLRAGVVSGVLFPLLCAARLVPTLVFLRAHPRLVPLDDKMNLRDLITVWTARAHDWSFPGHVFVWPEYGDYIGVVPVALGALAVVAALALRDERSRARRIDLVVFGVLLWCTLGATEHLSLFGALHHLPLYRSLRVPSRFLHPVTVAMALLIAHMLVALRARIAARWPTRPRLVTAFRVAEFALLVGVAVDMCRVNNPIIQLGLDPFMPITHAEAGMHLEPGFDYDKWYTYPTRGMGTTLCYVPIEWKVADTLWTGPGLQHRLSPEEAGAVHALPWTPNVLEFEVNLTRPAMLLVNTNNDAGWTTNVGSIVLRADSLMVRLPAGERRVTLRHRVNGFYTGVALNLAGVALAVWLWRRRSRELRQANP